ncbi:MAG: Stk1 family PASTA domain-containing Ser/Thr kinase [Gordonia sp. (in: high G+C Gram-positive bacteria)]
MTSTPHHLSDRYELGETLGFGGMSEVHFARDVLLNRDVAIKVLRADLARDPSFYLRFRREAQNAAKLNHPTIVQVFDTGEAETPDGPLPFIVMEYVDGDTLRDVLRANGPISPRQAMTWLADVAAAMDFSHRNGIVHRDMKPANVMIDKSGAVKVMDFGIARAISDSTSTMTMTSTVMGTAQYLSPEQARGIKVDPRSDIYSMGCVLFELLTGEPPFTGDSPVAVAHQHVHEDPPWPSSLRPDLPRELDSVVLKAMSKNKENRYQSAADLRSDLIKVLAGGKPSAPLLLTDADRTEFLDSGPRRALRNLESGSGGHGHGTHRREDTSGGDGSRRDEPRRRRSRALILGSVAAVILAITGLVVWWAPWTADSARQIAVPSVSGLSAQDAENNLHKAGFKVKKLEEPSLEVPEGNATRSAPGSTALAQEDSVVTLYLSSGPPRHIMPPLQGKTPRQATDALKVLGFTSVRVDGVESTTGLKGKVVSTTPATGTDAPVNGAVVLHVGTGPKEVTLPDLVGLTQAQAGDLLGRVNVKMVVVQADSELTSGQVISSSPGAGETVQEGSIVSVTVSRGNMFFVPNLRGRTPAQAQAALRAAGWTDSTLIQTPRNVGIASPDSGRILDQRPDPGTLAFKNRAIAVTVGQLSLLPN